MQKSSGIKELGGAKVFCLKYWKFIFLVSLTILLALISLPRIFPDGNFFSADNANFHTQLLSYIAKIPPGVATGLTLITIFNDLPSESQIEDLSIIHRKHEREVTFFTIFHRRFRNSKRLDFPSLFMTTKRMFITSQSIVMKKTIYLLFNNRRLVLMESQANLRDLHSCLMRYRFPEKKLNDYFISIEACRRKIIERFREAKGRFYEIDNRRPIAQFEIIQRFPIIYFIHAECSECELKAIIMGINQRRIWEDQEACFVFSAYGKRSALKRVMNDSGNKWKCYIDQDDQIDMMDWVIVGKEKSFRISREDIFGATL